MVCDTASVSGWANQAGILYQQARAVLACLSMLDGERPDLFAVHVESRQDLFDLELLDSESKALAALQIKNRQLNDVWTPSDIFPLLKEWAKIGEKPPGGLDLLLGGRLGPAGVKLQAALRSAAGGDLTELRELAGDRLDTHEVECAATVRLIVDPTQTASLITAGTQQGMSLLPDPRTGPDAQAEANAILGNLNLLIQQRAGFREAPQRVVRRQEVATLFGLNEQGSAEIWEASLRNEYTNRVRSLGRPKTVAEDLRSQTSPIQRAAGRTDAQKVELTDLLTRPEHMLISGQSGTGKSTAARRLRYEASIAGGLVVIANAEAFIPGRLAALVSNALAMVLGRPIGVAAARAALSDPSVMIIFDGASEMTSDQRTMFTEELSTRIHSPLSCQAVLVGRDPAVLNSVLPHEVPRSAFVLRGIEAEQREQLVRETLESKGLPVDDVSRIAAQARHALKDAASVPYLLAMAAELISYGFDIKSRAQMYYAFTEQMAERQGLVRLQFCTLGLGIAFNGLLNEGRRQCDQFTWAQVLARASELLAQRNVTMEPGEIDSIARRGGFVSYENYDQTVRPVHDSVADYFSALALSKNLAVVPEKVTENDALRLRFLAELTGVTTPVAGLLTSGIPFASVEISQFDRNPLGPDTAGQVEQLVGNMLRGSDLQCQSVQIGETEDARVFVFRGIGDNSRLLEADEVASSILKYGARETQPGPLQIAVALWKEILEEQLEPERLYGRIPDNASSAVTAVVDHNRQTCDAVEALVARLFPASCRERVLQFALPEPLDIAIKPGPRTEEPYWPMIWRSSTEWRVSVVDFASWKAGGEHSGWGSVDSVVRKSPLDTAKESILKAVNELVDSPWLR